MTPLFQTIRSTTVQIAATCGFLCLATLASADVIQSVYGGPTSYIYELSGMADFDQRRDPLPNNGSHYCVPTATLNMMAYVSNHGFPQVAPGDHNWSSPSLYNLTTGHLSLMGIMMSTGATSGTTGNGVTAGTNSWLGSNLGLFNVNHYFKSGNWSPTITHITEAAVAGKLVNFSYGRYRYLSQNSDTAFVTERTGGHRVTLVKAQRSGNTLFIGVRDPADDPDKPDPDNPQPDDNPNYLNSQSPFAMRTFPNARQIRVISPIAPFDRTMTALKFPLDDPDSDSKFAMIDSFSSISPKYGMTFTNTDTPMLWLYIPNQFFGLQQTNSVWETAAGSIVDMVASPEFTAWAMVGNLIDYYSNFEELWLLSLSGTLILALDIWILLEGFRTLRQIEDRSPSS